MEIAIGGDRCGCAGSGISDLKGRFHRPVAPTETAIAITHPPVHRGATRQCNIQASMGHVRIHHGVDADSRIDCRGAVPVLEASPLIDHRVVVISRGERHLPLTLDVVMAIWIEVSTGTENHTVPRDHT